MNNHARNAMLYLGFSSQNKFMGTLHRMLFNTYTLLRFMAVYTIYCYIIVSQFCNLNSK